jgi:GntR family transcriptional regulator/MocR family aminotransferase
MHALTDPLDPAFDLAVDLPPPGSRRVGRELHRQLRAAIVSGRLRPGLRLPASREFAAALGTSRNTVVGAYDLLLSEGYVRADGRAGTLVADFLSPAVRQRARDKPRLDPRLNPAWRDRQTLGSPGALADCRFNFRIGLIDPESFPFALWRRLSARALRAASRAPSDYRDPEGKFALREAIARHISFARAIACSPDEIVVTAGAQQAFDLLARILVTPGKTVVAVEDPGYPSMRNVLAAAGAKLVSVPVDDEGIRVDRIPRTARVICVTPSHQYPLGVRLSLARRVALLEFARAQQAVIIEDDYDGEFRYAGKPLDALQTLDRAESVFYVGTFSKCLFPDLRLGFIISPPWAMQALVAAKQLTDWHAPAITQEVLSAFITEGHLARHVRKMRRIYGERRQILERSLERHCSDRLRVVGVDAGLHLTAYLRNSLSAAALADKAREAGIALNTIRRFAMTRRNPDGLVFGYGAIESGRIEEGVRCLARLM